MNRLWRRRAWLIVGIAAIACVLVVLLVPQVHQAPGSQWMAILPLAVLGLISALVLRLPHFSICIFRVPDAPILPAVFQRPPPILFA